MERGRRKRFQWKRRNIKKNREGKKKDKEKGEGKGERECRGKGEREILEREG
jgi:hypothetical protein